MNNWENAVVTNKGIALLAKMMAGETLHITRGETGSGYVTPGTLQSQVAVTSPMQQVSFREATYPEEGKCALACFITNDDLNTAYTANQVGIYATDPDEGEILFFITQANSGKGLDIPTETEMPGYSSEWTFYFKFGQASGVTITVNPSHAVNFAEMEAHVDNKISKITPEGIGASPKDHKHTKSEITDFPTSMPPTEHKHTKSDITDFPTSMTPTAHKHSASDIDSGTLDRDRLPTIPVEKGGTGATTAEGARTNLGITPANLGLKTETFIFHYEDDTTRTVEVYVK